MGIDTEGGGVKSRRCACHPESRSRLHSRFDGLDLRPAATEVAPAQPPSLNAACHGPTIDLRQQGTSALGCNDYLRQLASDAIRTLEASSTEFDTHSTRALKKPNGATARLKMLSRLVALLSLAQNIRGLQIPFALKPEPSPVLQSLTYLGQERDLSWPAGGIWSLSSRASHQLPVPLHWTRADQDLSNKDNSTDNSTDQLQWWLTSSNGSISVPALFPSQAHLDLLSAGVIAEPSIGLNEGTSRWIMDETWSYTASLEPLLHHLAGWDTFLLYSQGLDTVCDVKIGDSVLARTDNQFREWLFDTAVIREALLAEVLTNITLIFHPATTYALNESLREPHYPDQLENPDGPASSVYEYPARNFVRKTQSDFGWDWGPAYAPVGPHKPAYLVGFRNKSSATAELRTHATAKTSQIFVRSTSLEIYKTGSRNNLPPDQGADWTVNVTLDLYSTVIIDEAYLHVRVLHTPHKAELRLPRIKAGYNDGLSVSFCIPSQGEHAPELWWPTKLGNPRLYDVRFTLATSSSAKESAVWSKRTGFRTVVLNQEPVATADVDSGWGPGAYFHIEINGRRIYVQGSNLIPFDTFYPRISLEVISWHVRSALLSGQNLIRVWGGGLYQSDAFYDLCDELGILVWSETIFAVSMYPTYDDFIDNVRVEVQENVRRLNHHPSQTHWAGNNEGEQGMLAVTNSLANGTVYQRQYEYLFDEVVRETVLANSRAMSYIPSSTTHGYLSLDPYVPRYLSKREGEVYGDGEYYGYSVPQFFNTSTYSYETEYRLINEYGMHSMSSMYGLRRVLEKPEDYAFNSTVLRAHNKHSPAGGLDYPFPADDGQGQMWEGIKMYLPVPNVTEQELNAESHAPRSAASISKRESLLSHLAYLTQVLQAVYISTQTYHYRFRASLPSRNLGGVYWQLNDVWPGSTSWSSMEWGGRWNPLHYAMSRAQGRIAAYANWNADEESLSLVILSDVLDVEGNVQGVLNATWYDWSGMVLNSTSFSWSSTGIGASVVSPPLPLSEYLPTRAEPKDAWLHLVLTGDVNRSGTPLNSVRYNNEEFWSAPTSLRDAPLLDPRLTMQHLGNDRFNVSVGEASTVAPFVWLEHPEGVLGYFAQDDDEQLPSNGFWLKGGESRTVRFVRAFDDGMGTHSGFVARTLRW